MSNINLLTQYLNPNKHKFKSSGRNELIFVRIDQNFIDANGDYLSDNVLKTYFTQPFDNSIDFRRTYKEVFYRERNLGPLYVETTSNDAFYYFKKEINGETKYLSLSNAINFNTHIGYYQSINDNDLVPVTLEINQRLFYNKDLGFLYLSEELLAEIVFTTKRTLTYNANDLDGLKSGTHKLDFTDATGDANSFLDIILRSTSEVKVQDQKRGVKVQLNPQKGELYWYPKLDFIYKTTPVLEYQYDTRGNDDNDDTNKQSYAIRLEFEHPESFLAFMNLTYFNNGVSSFDLNEGSGFRKTFLFEGYVLLVNELLKSPKTSFDEKLSYLFYIPEELFIKEQNLFRRMKDPSNILGANFIWNILSNVLEDAVTNIGLNKEDIVIKLLRILKLIIDYKVSNNEDEKKIESQKRYDYLLDQLLYRTTSNGNSYFLQLFKKIDGDNFASFNELMKAIWLNSTYTNLDHPIYSEKAEKDSSDELKYSGPLILPYKSDKTLGFYHSNVDISWGEKGKILNTILESGKFEFTGERNSRGAPEIKEIKYYYNYHPYQLIYIKQADKQNTALKLDNIIPAFYLKAVETKKTTSNIYTGIEYGADILTTLSGVGNLAKFRHLARIVKTAKSLNKSKKVIRGFTIYKGVRGFAAGVEITSGTINALLKITGINDSEFGKALSEYLFWVEMLSLGGELSVAIRNGLKKSAKALTSKKSADTLEKHLDDLVKKGEINELRKHQIIDDLENLAEKAIKSYKQKLIELYERGYQYRKVGMPSGQVITKLFTRHGNRIADSVNRQVKIYTKTLSNAEIRGRVLVSGIGCRKYTKEIILHTNFPKNKLNQFLLKNNILRGETTLKDVKKIYKHLLSEGHIKYDLHPLLEKRIAFHFAELKKGIKHSSNYKWENTGGLPGIHSEILSVNEMLWKIELEQGIKLTDNVFKDMIGFNKHIRYNNPMVRCGDCNFLTYDIPFIEKLLDLK